MPNVTKGAAAEYGEIMSEKLRQAIQKELTRAFKEDPTMAGWKGLKETNPVLFRNVSGGVK
jgi:hypothetical protein